MTDKHDIDLTVLARESFKTIRFAPTPPDYTADGLIDIRVDYSYLDVEPVTWDLIEDTEPVDRCKWIRAYSYCWTPRSHHAFCPGTCEHYEPVDRGGGLLFR